MALADIRREYNLAGLRRADLAPDPIAQFRMWLDQATGARRGGRVRRFCISLYKRLLLITGTAPAEVNAAMLATATNDGSPSARVVLLKGVDERGFIFFTNYGSRKGLELAHNSRAALVFYWSDLERQVCISGAVSKIPRAESEAYFNSRPKGSRLAARASNQSEPVANRGVLEQRWAELAAKYPGENVPMPEHWGGFVLSPERMEFWQGRPNRMHDRFQYTLQPDKTWRIDRLAP
jgi:pyridoxamine 5'-phosphate oxidase